MIQTIRLITQLTFFSIFILLMISGKAQFWMAFIFISIALASIFGRFYCGWACPINTLIRPVSWMARRIGTQKKSIPAFLKTERPRYIVFLVFLGLLGYTIYSITQGRKFPLPLIVIPFGLLTTIFINPTAWHRYLCPWGTFFNFTARFAKFGLKINKHNCKSCGYCQRLCPTESMVITMKHKPTITTTNCLECFDCQTACPTNSIGFGLLRRSQNQKINPDTKAG